MAEDKKSTKGTKVITERSIAFGSTGTQNKSNTNTDKSNSGDSGDKSSTKDSSDGQSKKK